MRSALKHDVLEAVSAAEFALLGLVAVLVHDVQVGRDPVDLRLGIHPAGSGRNEGPMDTAHCLDHVPPLVLPMQRMTGSLEEPDVLVTSDNHVEVAQRGCLAEELD